MIGRFALRAASALILLFLLAPLLSIVLSSFSAGPLFVFPVAHVTLRWYREISPDFYRALLISLEVGAGATALGVVLGVPAGLSLVRSEWRWAHALTTATLTPLMLPTLVLGVAALLMMNALSDIGLVLMETIPGLILAHTAFTLPFVIRAVVSAQAQYDRQADFAAMNLGATPLRALLTVTLPALAPAVASGAIFAFLTSFDDVPIALFLGGSHATTLPVAIFNSLQFDLSPSLLAMSTLITVGILLAVLISARFLGLQRFIGGDAR